MASRKTSNQQRKRPECHTPDLTITRNAANTMRQQKYRAKTTLGYGHAHGQTHGATIPADRCNCQAVCVLSFRLRPKTVGSSLATSSIICPIHLAPYARLSPPPWIYCRFLTIPFQEPNQLPHHHRLGCTGYDCVSRQCVWQWPNPCRR